MMNDLSPLEIPTWRPIQQKGRFEVNEENVDKMLQAIRKSILEYEYIDVYMRRYGDWVELELERCGWT